MWRKKPKPLAKEGPDWKVVKAPVQSLNSVFYNFLLNMMANSFSKEPSDGLALELDSPLESPKRKPV